MCIRDRSWTAIGGQLPISDQVIRLAKLAKDCGMDGVVCSALEAKMIREACGDDLDVYKRQPLSVGTA